MAFFSHTTSRYIPRLDTTQNTNNTTVDSGGIILRLLFSKELITTDTTGEDVTLNINRVWIWAMGSISSQGNHVIFQYSMASRGTLNSGEPVALPCQSGLKLNNVIDRIFVNLKITQSGQRRPQ